MKITQEVRESLNDKAREFIESGGELFLSSPDAAVRKYTQQASREGGDEITGGNLGDVDRGGL
jgi:hypothetical protein